MDKNYETLVTVVEKLVDILDEINNSTKYCAFPMETMEKQREVRHGINELRTHLKQVERFTHNGIPVVIANKSSFFIK